MIRQWCCNIGIDTEMIPFKTSYSNHNKTTIVEVSNVVRNCYYF